MTIEPVYQPGDRIPGTSYNYVAPVGSGGHGSVIAVQHAFLKKRRCVMKLLHAEHGTDDDLVRRAIEEAQILAAIDHPNIVSVLDGGITAEARPRPFFVMEALTGMSLHTALRSAPRGLGFSTSVSIILGVLDGLDAAHTGHRVIHRDIKPSNIFLHRTPTDTTVPKVLDFGIAFVTRAAKRHTGRAMIGTPRYIAPEQVRGDRATARTDLYATGLVLYEMLVGRDPYNDVQDFNALIHAHLEKPAPRLRQYLEDAPVALDEMVACMLHKDPARRPESAAAAAIALRRIKEDIDRLHLRGLDRPDFQTEPTPLDNDLISTAAREVTAPPDAPNDTVPNAPPLALAETDAATTEKDRLPFETTTPSPAKPLDRNAMTREARNVPSARRPRSDTQKLAGTERVAPASSAFTPTNAAVVTPIDRHASITPAPPRADKRTPWAIGFACVFAVLAIGGALYVTRAPAKPSATPIEAAPPATVPSAVLPSSTAPSAALPSATAPSAALPSAAAPATSETPLAATATPPASFVAKRRPAPSASASERQDMNRKIVE